MSVGTSGRIVIEVEPEFKRQLYEALEREELTLKEWFLRNAKKFLNDGVQLSLDFSEQTTLSATSAFSSQIHTRGHAVQPPEELQNEPT